MNFVEWIQSSDEEKVFHHDGGDVKLKIIRLTKELWAILMYIEKAVTLQFVVIENVDWEEGEGVSFWWQKFLHKIIASSNNFINRSS